jgi:hypothetical protein
MAIHALLRCVQVLTAGAEWHKALFPPGRKLSSTSGGYMAILFFFPLNPFFKVMPFFRFPQFFFVFLAGLPPPYLFLTSV